MESSVNHEGRYFMEERMNKDLLGGFRNFVFIGESGSGKTELGIHVALMLKKLHEEVHFFDLDQTKPLFRARDVKELMEEKGIVVHVRKQFQDIPSMVSGVAESLQDPGQYTLLDIGGNVHGALMAGQLERYLNTEETCVFYLINVYRPWSRDAVHIRETRDSILGACKVAQVRLISNPSLGPSTTFQEIVEGHRRLGRMLGDGARIDYVCVPEHLPGDARFGAEELGADVIPIRPCIHMPGVQSTEFK